MFSGLWSTDEEQDILVQELGTQVINSCKGSPETARVPPRASSQPLRQRDAQWAGPRDRRLDAEKFLKKADKVWLSKIYTTTSFVWDEF